HVRHSVLVVAVAGSTSPQLLFSSVAISLLFFFFFFMLRLLPISTLFPYTTLFRSISFTIDLNLPASVLKILSGKSLRIAGLFVGDRKSTRLNSSHVKISYAVFCLKKKKKKKMSRNLEVVVSRQDMTVSVGVPPAP